MINNIGLELLRNPTQVQLQYIDDLSSQYENPEKIKQTFFAGNAGSFISYGYLKKLKFSDEVLGLIGSWNNPEHLSERLKKYIIPLYVAEVMLAYSEKQLDFYQIDQKYLAKFDIYTEDQFNYILNKLNDAFSDDNK